MNIKNVRIMNNDDFGKNDSNNKPVFDSVLIHRMTKHFSEDFNDDIVTHLTTVDDGDYIKLMLCINEKPSPKAKEEFYVTIVPKMKSFVIRFFGQAVDECTFQMNYDSSLGKAFLTWIKYQIRDIVVKQFKPSGFFINDEIHKGFYIQNWSSGTIVVDWRDMLPNNDTVIESEL